MLRNFLLLDEAQLNQYISQIEDGLRRASSRSISTEKGGGIEINAKVAKLGLNGRSVDGESQDYADDGPARFERLLALVEGDEEQFGWRDLQENPDALDGLRPGHLLAFAAELFEADVSSIANPRGIMSMLPLAQAISKMPGQRGADKLEKAFDGGTLEAMQSFSAAMEGKTVVQGDIIDSDYRFVSVVPGSMQLDGTAYVVGKVSKVWGQGEWRILPGLPFFSQLPRDRRREMERKGPTDGNTLMWMEGPAIHLDLLAVYR